MILLRQKHRAKEIWQKCPGNPFGEETKLYANRKKRGQALTCPVSCSGAKSGTRTHDLFVTNEMLYRLSYFGNARILAELRVQIWEKFPEFPGKNFHFFSPDHVLITQAANYQKYKRHANHDRQSVKAKAGTPPLFPGPNGHSRPCRTKRKGRPFEPSKLGERL